MSAKSVRITMNDATVNALAGSNYYLYGFKAVEAPITTGKPLVWFRTQIFSVNTRIEWQERYEAYTSRGADIAPNTQISASASYPISPGQTLRVQRQPGTGIVVAAGVEGTISIHNQTSNEFKCGISQQQSLDGQARVTPLCAFPLYGQHLVTMTPIEKILLMFSTDPVRVGTVIVTAYSPGILIDMTGNVTERQVEYDINEGWKWDGAAPPVWGQHVPANASLLPLLILRPST